MKYTCRRCGEVVEEDEEAFMTVHECDDGGLGVADKKEE